MNQLKGRQQQIEALNDQAMLKQAAASINDSSEIQHNSLPLGTVRRQTYQADFYKEKEEGDEKKIMDELYNKRAANHTNNQFYAQNKQMYQRRADIDKQVVETVKKQNQMGNTSANSLGFAFGNGTQN